MEGRFLIGMLLEVVTGIYLFLEKCDITLDPRQPSSKPVVLWIVYDEVMLNLCETVTEGERLAMFRGYELVVRSYVHIYM